MADYEESAGRYEAGRGKDQDDHTNFLTHKSPIRSHETHLRGNQKSHGQDHERASNRRRFIKQKAACNLNHKSPMSTATTYTRIIVAMSKNGNMLAHPIQPRTLYG